MNILNTLIWRQFYNCARTLNPRLLTAACCCLILSACAAQPVQGPTPDLPNATLQLELPASAQNSELLTSDVWPILRQLSDEKRRSQKSELIYKVLVAELALRQDQYIVAAQNLLDVARITNDPKIAERAAQVALHAEDEALAMEAIKLWQINDPDNEDARKILISLLLRQNSIEEALRHLDDMPGSKEFSRERIDIFVMLLRRAENSEEALAMVSELAEKRPEDPVILMIRAHLLIENNAPDQAVAVLEQIEPIAAKQSEPGPIYFEIARLAMGAEDYTRALNAIEKVLAVEPDNTDAMRLYADVMSRKGESKLAIRRIGQYLAEQEKAAPELRLVYGRMLAYDNRFEDAIEQFEILLKDSPDNEDLLFTLGTFALELERLDTAERYFKKLLELGKQEDAARFFLGQIAEQNGDHETAIDFYQNVFSGRYYLIAQMRVGILRADGGDLDAALSHIDTIETGDAQDDVRLIGFKAELLVREKRYQEALAIYNDALDTYPDNIDLLYNRAMLAEKVDRIDLLEQDLRRILDMEPENADALNSLGYTLADRTDRYQEAYTLIQRANALKPDQHYILDSMGWVLYRLGKYEEAAKYLREALAKQSDPEVASHLVEVLWVSGEQAEARAVWESASAEFPEDDKLQKVKERLFAAGEDAQRTSEQQIAN